MNLKWQVSYQWYAKLEAILLLLLKEESLQYTVYRLCDVRNWLDREIQFSLKICFKSLKRK